MVSGYFRNKYLWMAILVISFFFSAAVVSGGLYVAIRKWNPVGGAGDILISLLVIGVIVLLLRITHSGKRAMAGVAAAAVTLRVIDSAGGISYRFMGEQPYLTICFMVLMAIFLFFAVVTASRVHHCLIPVVLVGDRGVFVRSVYKNYIPWSAVELVEEFVEYGMPSFRVVLKNGHGIEVNFIWSLYEKHPTISTKVYDIDPMTLRDAFSARVSVAVFPKIY